MLKILLRASAAPCHHLRPHHKIQTGHNVVHSQIQMADGKPPVGDYNDNDTD